jgi:hypothetical protein
MNTPTLVLVESQNHVSIDIERTITVSKKMASTEFGPRIQGSFKGRAFFLRDCYEWVLGKDENGSTILVPLKKA